MYYLTNYLFFDILLLDYYTNLNLSIICCLFSDDIYLSFGIALLAFSVECLSFEYNSFGDFEILVILSAILLPIKSSVASVVFECLFLKQFLLRLL